MMTLIARLCALCAMSALMEMALCTSRLKGALRAICGMLMIETTLVHLTSLGDMLTRQRDLQDFFECLMK